MFFTHRLLFMSRNASAHSITPSTLRKRSSTFTRFSSSASLLGRCDSPRKITVLQYSMLPCSISNRLHSIHTNSQLGNWRLIRSISARAFFAWTFFLRTAMSIFCFTTLYDGMPLQMACALGFDIPRLGTSLYPGEQKSREYAGREGYG